MENQIIEQVLIGTVVTVILAILSWFGRQILVYVFNVFVHYFRDLPDVSGTWKNSYSEPDAAGQVVHSSETATVQQRGGLVWGRIVPDTRPEIRFEFKGKLRRSVLVCSYEIRGRKTVTGTGAFTLKIEENNRQMSGHCIWQDYDTDNIESSPYMWRRSNT